VIKSRFREDKTGTGTVTFALVAPEVHERNTAVTEYMYVFEARPVSWHEREVVNAVGDVPQAGLGVDPRNLVT
jgi:hypothetical protein